MNTSGLCNVTLSVAKQGAALYGCAQSSIYLADVSRTADNGSSIVGAVWGGSLASKNLGP